MKPLHLTLQGFTAFRQYTELDFTGLDLFALVGPTGSGKSSLLDAMTFALYGKTARLGATGMDALISQGERALSVSLTFEVGGQTYRASRTKGRKAAENEARLDRLDSDGEWTGLSSGALKDINARIEEVLGLPFENFTRCVMLPQGQFAAVLHGKSQDRQKLLGDLIGLDHVRKMYEAASARVTEYKATSASLNTVLEREYAGVTEEAANDLRARREALASEIERLTQSREDLQARQVRLRELERLWRAQEDAARKLAVEQGQAGRTAEGLARAQRARQVAGVLPLLDLAERTRLENERHAGELAGAEAAVQRATAALAQAAAALEQAQREEERIPELEARAELLRAAEGDAARLRRARVSDKLTHPDPLPWDEDQYEEARLDAEKLARLRKDREDLTRRRLAFELAQKAQQRDLAQLETLQAEKGRIESEGKQARNALRGAEKALQDARLRVGIAAYRTHLHAGEPCPLCLQTVHDLPPEDATDMRALEGAVDLAKAEVESRLDRHRELSSEIKGLETLTADRALTLADTQAQLLDEERDLRAAEARISGDPETTLQRLLATLAARVRQAGGDPAGARQRVLAEIQGLRRGVSAAQNAHATAQSEHAAASAQLAAALKQGAEHERRAREAAEGLAAQLATLGLSAQEARAAGMPEHEIAALEKAAQEHQGRLAQLQATLADVQQQLGGKGFDPAELSQLLRDLTASEAALSSAQQEGGKLAEQERSLRERLSLKATKEAEAKAAAGQFDTWQTLTNALRANEFQQFMLAETEADLLTNAGQLLYDISDGRYRLKLEKNDYAVQDLWNAGEIRAVKTLSGGETFLASLALAIALSDYLAGNRVLGALFLDEGFGTLDPQALDAVATALENLRTQGRMVGIVTHVESLSERLPARLLVSKSMAGSQVMRVEGL